MTTYEQKQPSFKKYNTKKNPQNNKTEQKLILGQ